MNQIQLIIQPGRGYAKAWFVTQCVDKYLKLNEGPFAATEIMSLTELFEEIYSSASQTPTGFHKNGKQINLDVVYRAGVDTLTYPLPDWWLSYGGE